MATKYKVGDRVKIIRSLSTGGSVFDGGVKFIGTVANIISVDETNSTPYSLEDVSYCWHDKELELITSANPIKMNLKEKFLLAFKSEPQKSFRQKGITNGDDMLTEEGQAVFLTWLLQKHADDFKKEVVDNIENEK